MYCVSKTNKQNYEGSGIPENMTVTGLDREHSEETIVFSLGDNFCALTIEQTEKIMELVESYKKNKKDLPTEPRNSFIIDEDGKVGLA